MQRFNGKRNLIAQSIRLATASFSRSVLFAVVTALASCILNPSTVAANDDVVDKALNSKTTETVTIVRGFSSRLPSTENASYRRSVMVIEASPQHEWRKTKEGWKQIRVHAGQTPHRIVTPVRRPLIHPFQIAALILLTSLAAAAWASSEWDWARMVGAELDDNQEEPVQLKLVSYD